ncbi:hypothetical protein [Salisediminibacterium selenitireducens]|uniref:hypothetical protein n=1 Tax=Salisediminibacterium selenitireducens TaxID=85683 RepID=UPI00031299FF|nr:hypothetical protein [Salisediminibacterium selenitireducens]
MTKNKLYVSIAYDGFSFHGILVRTMVRGKSVMIDGVVTGEPGYGQLVKPARDTDKSTETG